VDRGDELELREWVKNSRLEQGLPEHVEDVEALSRIAELFSSKDGEEK
jgi:hypothetical protein